MPSTARKRVAETTTVITVNYQKGYILEEKAKNKIKLKNKKQKPKIEQF